jgi:hypothetical protein
MKWLKVHPDYLRECGAWFDLSPTYCGKCERCKKEGKQ